MAADKINLLDLTLPELVQLVVEWGEPRFRATQIWRWLYSNLASDPGEMLNLSKDLRQRLQEKTYVGYLKPVTSTMDEDQLTEKVLFETMDGQFLETVLMRYTNRNSICVSSQIGCPLGCTICATGQRGFAQLTTGEVAAQTLYFARKLREAMPTSPTWCSWAWASRCSATPSGGRSQPERPRGWRWGRGALRCPRRGLCRASSGWPASRWR